MKNSFKLLLFIGSITLALGANKTQEVYIPDSAECKVAFSTLPVIADEVNDYINKNDIDLVFRQKLNKHHKLMLFIVANCNMNKDLKLTLRTSISENAETVSIVERHLKKKGIL